MFRKKRIYGYFYLDQLAGLKFRVFHMLLEKCKYISTFHFSNPQSRGVPDDLFKISRDALVWLPVGSTFFFIAFGASWHWHIAGGFDVIAMCVTYALFQLPTILYILSPLPIMDTTPSVNSPISFNVFFRKSNRAASCR